MATKKKPPETNSFVDWENTPEAIAEADAMNDSFGGSRYDEHGNPLPSLPGQREEGDATEFAAEELQAMQTLFGRRLTAEELDAVRNRIEAAQHGDDNTAVLSDVFDMRGTTSLEFTDAWTGFTAGPPPTFWCRLERTEAGGMEGRSTLSLPTDSGGSTNVSKPVLLTPRQASLFLKKLGNSVLRPGEYDPLLMHTDDYPHLELALHAGGVGNAQPESAVLYTASQGEFNAPWGVFANMQVFHINGEEVGRALKSIERHLGRRGLEREVFGR